MKKYGLLALALCACWPGAWRLAAQTAAMPPAVLSVLREEIKPGRTAAHDNFETGYGQAFGQAKWPVGWLGMMAVSGPNEAWFITPYASFAALEKDRQDMEKTPALQQRLNQLEQGDAEFRANQRTLIAVFNQDLSYHPERLMPGLPKARYFNVLTVRMRPGRDLEFNQAVRGYLAALEKAKSEDSFVTYQVVSGAPGGTFLVFVALKSLAELDGARAREQAVNQALGMEDGQKLLKNIAESFLTTESTLFAFNPKLSYVTPEFAAGDPAFWTPKPAPKKLAAKTP